MKFQRLMCAAISLGFLFTGLHCYLLYILVFSFWLEYILRNFFRKKSAWKINCPTLPLSLIDSLSSKFEVNFLLGLPKLSAVGYAQKACACQVFILLLPFLFLISMIYHRKSCLSTAPKDPPVTSPTNHYSHCPPKMVATTSDFYENQFLAFTC